MRGCQVTLGPQGPLRRPVVGLAEVWAQPGGMIGAGQTESLSGQLAVGLLFTYVASGNKPGLALNGSSSLAACAVEGP